MRRDLLVLFVIVLCALLLPSCEHTTFRSSVPNYPVRFSIDTRLGPFVHFANAAQNEYVTLNRDGYRYNGEWVAPCGAMDAYGYGGVVVFVGMNGYAAYDLACPYCAGRGACQPCGINGFFAVCPECGEEYDLGSGTAAPQKGIANEFLRRYKLIASDGKLTVTP